MNFKLKCLMAVSAISFGLSAVNASASLPENPEDRTIRQELQVALESGDVARVDELRKQLEIMAEVDAALRGIGDE